MQSELCQCPITLVLHDRNSSTCHFNLLWPVQKCCVTPLPTNVFTSKQINPSNHQLLNNHQHQHHSKQQQPAVNSKQQPAVNSKQQQSVSQSVY